MVSIAYFYRPITERMTNGDVLKMLDSFGTGDRDYLKPIYGPKTTKLIHPNPPSSGGNGGDDGLNIYPDIYGPDNVDLIPGKSGESSKSGKSSKSGESSKSGKSSKSGESSKSGKSGKGDKSGKSGNADSNNESDYGLVSNTDLAELLPESSNAVSPYVPDKSFNFPTAQREPSPYVPSYSKLQK